MTQPNQLFAQPKTLIAAAAITGLLLVIFLALGIIGGDSQTSPGNTPLPPTALPEGAQLIQLDQQLTRQTQDWQGTIQSRHAIKIAPKLTGRILEITTRPGTAVKQGTVLARLDDRELRATANAANAALAAAKAQATQASNEEKRINSLYQQQAATQQQYQAVLAQAQASQALLNQAASNAQQSQVLLAENQLRAPFDGVVGEWFQEPGDMGLINQALLSFYQPDDLRLETTIASHCLSQLQLGMAMTVKIDESAQTLTGILDEIAPDIDPVTHSRQLKISLPNTANLRHGQFGWLQLSCAAEQALILVPETAIIHFGQLEAVKIFNNQQLEIRHIRTGKRYGQQLQVLSGLHAGETIIANAGVLP